MIDDRVYWDKFYSSKHDEISNPSSFAKFVFDNFLYDKSGARLVEFGCGNGRDSLFFIKNNINVTAIDSSDVSISKLEIFNNKSDTNFICADFTSDLEIYKQGFDFCYSRFTLHAINDEQEKALFENIAKMLNKNGLLFIEARSINDGKFGHGEAVGKREFILDGHYRRFIDKNILKNNLEKLGFKIVSLEESSDFAPKKGENCVCLRTIAKISWTL